MGIDTWELVPIDAAPTRRSFHAANRAVDMRSGAMHMRIAVWAEGVWCRIENVESFRKVAGLNDDYSTHFAANEAEADLVAVRVAKHAAGVRE